MRNLKPEQDSYGKMLWVYYHGKDVFEIVERDDGYFDENPGPKIYFSAS
jgi:hypothetical protein